MYNNNSVATPMSESSWMEVCQKFKDNWLPEIPDPVVPDGDGEGEGEGECVNTAPAGAKDKYGDDCSDYEKHPGWCGDNSQTAEFDQTTMCCACGGGETGGGGGGETKTEEEKFKECDTTGSDEKLNSNEFE